MDANLTKSLTDLIDETLQELDELRKSRFAAAEIKIEGPGDGIAGKPADGNLEAKKAEDEEEDESEEHEEEEHGEDEDEAKKAESCEKADPTEDPADSSETKRKIKSLMNKKEDDKEDEEDEEEPHKDDPKHEEKEKKIAKQLLDMHKKEIKKSSEENSSLMKSYVEERVKPLEDKLSVILDLVNKIADQPVTPRGITARTTPLLKSAEDSQFETLSKAQVANKLFELKKSGTKVDSLDIAKAEMGQDLATIVKKYEI